MTEALAISMPLRLGNGLNDRGHWRSKARRVKCEREAVAWALILKTRLAPPLVVTITRIAPSVGLDSDNLAGSCKGCRDEIAHWLGIDDADERVHYRYAQRRGPWGVEISMVRGRVVETVEAA